jgi:hypothetical protein
VNTDPPHRPADDPHDVLAERYRAAVRLAGDGERRPSDAVRAAILAQAEAQAQSREEPVQAVAPAHVPAANDGRWRLSALASVMVMALAGLLAWQVEREPQSDVPQVAMAPAPAAEPATTEAAAPAPTAAEPARDDRESVRERAVTRQEQRAAAKAAPQAVRRENEPARERYTPLAATRPLEAERAAPPAAADAQAGSSAAAAPMPAPAAAPPAPAIEARRSQPQGMAADRALRAPAPQSAQGPAGLSQAAARGDAQRVQELLAAGAPADTRDAQGRTPLLEAVLLGDGSRRYVDAARLLLEARADPNAADRDGVTPLAHARRLGHDELARLIESYGGH